MTVHMQNNPLIIAFLVDTMINDITITLLIATKEVRSI